MNSYNSVMNMVSFNAITDEDLFAIINSNDLKDITRKLNLSQKQALKAHISEYPVTTLHHKKSQALLSTFTEGPSIPVYLLGVILGTLSISYTPLIIISASVFSLMFIAGSIQSIGTYQELNEDAEKEAKLNQFMQFQVDCANELIRRQRKQLSQQHVTSNLKLYANEPAQPVLNEKMPLLKPTTQTKKKKGKLLPQIKDSLSIVFTLSLIIFESFYFPLVFLAKGLAFAATASALLSPLGLGIAIGITVALGMFLGYKHYQHNKNKEMIQSEHDAIQKEFNSKHKECYHLKDLLYHSCKSEPQKSPHHSQPRAIPIRSRKFALKRTVYFTNTSNHMFKERGHQLNINHSKNSYDHAKSCRRHH